jgi:hypothetical protein
MRTSPGTYVRFSLYSCKHTQHCPAYTILLIDVGQQGSHTLQVQVAPTLTDECVTCAEKQMVRFVVKWGDDLLIKTKCVQSSVTSGNECDG